MSKRFVAILFVCLIVFNLTGCVSFIPTVSNEDAELMADYVAFTTMKYANGYERKLLSEEEKKEAITQEVITREEAAKKEEEEKKKKEEEIKETTPDELPVEEVSKTASVADLSDFIELNGTLIDYEGYRFSDIYPDAQTEELVFTMNASEGNTFLILDMEIANISGNDLYVDIPATESIFRISVNDGEYVPAMMSYFGEDFLRYKDTLAIETGVNTFLIFEVPQGTQIDSLKLSVIRKNTNEKKVFSLQ